LGKEECLVIKFTVTGLGERLLTNQIDRSHYIRFHRAVEIFVLESRGLRRFLPALHNIGKGFKRKAMLGLRIIHVKSVIYGPSNSEVVH
jgi:hypothetical protein